MHSSAMTDEGSGSSGEAQVVFFSEPPGGLHALGPLVPGRCLLAGAAGAAAVEGRHSCLSL